MSDYLIATATGPTKTLDKSNTLSQNFVKRTKTIRHSDSLSSYDGGKPDHSARSVSGFSSFSRPESSMSFLKSNRAREKSLSLFERKLVEFNRALTKIKENGLGEAIDRSLNETVRDDGPLLTLPNLELLRYNYFEAFEPNHKLVEKALAKKQPAYVHVISADEQIDEMCNQELARGGSGLALAAESARAKTAAMERKLACLVLNHAGHTSSIRDAFLLLLFWDDVYHDIKCESLDENYYEWLPQKETTQRFFVELADFALYRLRSVKCQVLQAEVEELNYDEAHELTRNVFFYYQKADLPLLQCLAQFLDKNFASQIKVYVSSPQPRHVRSLMTVMVNAVGDNLKLHFYGHSRAETSTGLFLDFMRCFICSILLDLPKPAVTSSAASVASVSKTRSSRPSYSVSVSDRVTSGPDDVNKLRRGVGEKMTRKRFFSMFRS